MSIHQRDRYVASPHSRRLHDLRSSLRAIAIYVDLLEAELNNPPSSFHKRCLDGLTQTIMELDERIQAVRTEV